MSWQGYARRIATEQMSAEAGCTVKIALKDVGYMRQMAEASEAPLPLADLTFNKLLAASANGHGDKDVGALLLVAQQQAGCKEGAHKLKLEA
jgi:3-hydroxyisobutyrate dehydrogenase-like beta-hydroxyacid dehydrogenase